MESAAAAIVPANPKRTAANKIGTKNHNGGILDAPPTIYVGSQHAAKVATIKQADATDPRLRNKEFTSSDASSQDHNRQVQTTT